MWGYMSGDGVRAIAIWTVNGSMYAVGFDSAYGQFVAYPFESGAGVIAHYSDGDLSDLRIALERFWDV